MKTVKLPSGEVIEDRRSNENGWLVRWIIASFWGLILIGGSAWATTFHSTLKEIQSVQSDRSRIIATLQSENSFILKRLDRMEGTLDVINAKLTELYILSKNGKGTLRK